MAVLLCRCVIFVYMLLTLEHCTLFTLCQEKRANGLVYTGTGVNGSCKLTSADNQIVVLGGLFAIHRSENKMCAYPGINPVMIQDVEAMVQTVDKINRDENFIPGVTLAYEIRDTCSLPHHALEQAILSLFMSEKGLRNNTGLSVSGFVGTSFSSVSLLVAGLLRIFRIPQISYSATANQSSQFDNFYRMVPPDTLQARAIVDIIVHFNWSYVVGIYSDDTYGNDGITAILDELDSGNWNVCVDTLFSISTSATTEKFDFIVDMINHEWIANSSVIILFCHLKDAEGIFEAILRRQATDEELGKRSLNITWIGSDSLGNSISPKYYSVAHGMISTIPQVRQSEEFDDYFLSLHPNNNSANPWFNEYWEEIFNCSLGMRTGVSNCDLMNQIQSRENGRYRQNNFLPLVIDTVYAFAHAIRNMQRDHCIRGGRTRGLCPKVLETRQQQTVIKGELLLEYLRDVSFQGTSSDRIKFNQHRYLESGYNIINLQVDSAGQFSYVSVGQWDSDPPERKTSLVIYDNIQWKHSHNGTDIPESICSYPCGNGEYRQTLAHRCCWMCVSCEGTNQIGDGETCYECGSGFQPNEERSECIIIQPDFLTWTNPLAIVTIILALLGLACTTFVAIMFIVYHNHHIIKASSRELSAILIIGVGLCYVMPFFYIAKPSPVFCAIRRFGVGFCFSLCFSALLVKTNRIHRIFNRSTSSAHSPPLISPLSQLFFTALLVSVQVFIATVWLAAEQPSIVHTYSKSKNELVCGANPYVGLSVILAYNVLLLIVTTYFSFRTRNVPENFNEAKFINLNMYTLCILWLAFIPSYFITAALKTSFHTGILLIAILLSGTVILCCLLAPKIYFLFFKKVDGNAYQSTTLSSASFHMVRKKKETGTLASTSYTYTAPMPQLSSDENKHVNVSIDTDDSHQHQRESCNKRSSLADCSDTGENKSDLVDTSHIQEISLDRVDSTEQSDMHSHQDCVTDHTDVQEISLDRVDSGERSDTHISSNKVKVIDQNESQSEYSTNQVKHFDQSDTLEIASQQIDQSDIYKRLSGQIDQNNTHKNKVSPIDDNKSVDVSSGSTEVR